MIKKMEFSLDKKATVVFSLSGAIIVFDQIIKAIIVKMIPENGSGLSFFGGFLKIIHRRNTAVAFSWGENLPEPAKLILFKILALIFLIGLSIYLLKKNEFTGKQRWALAGIIGGGFGNIIDRFFRPAGVVDFIDCRFFTLPVISPSGRFPTFNIADSAIVVATIILFILILTEEKKNGPSEKPIQTKSKNG